MRHQHYPCPVVSLVTPNIMSTTIHLIIHYNNLNYLQGANQTKYKRPSSPIHVPSLTTCHINRMSGLRLIWLVSLDLITLSKEDISLIMSTTPPSISYKTLFNILPLAQAFIKDQNLLLITGLWFECVRSCYILLTDGWHNTFRGLPNNAPCYDLWPDMDLDLSDQLTWTKVVVYQSVIMSEHSSLSGVMIVVSQQPPQSKLFS